MNIFTSSIGELSYPKQVVETEGLQTKKALKPETYGNNSFKKAVLNISSASNTFNSTNRSEVCWQ